MRAVDSWLEEYGESHQNRINKALHWVCVPLIVFSLIGILWSLPVPRFFAEISPIMTWGTLFLMASIVYYFIMSTTLAIGMVFISGAVIYLLASMERAGIIVWQVSIAIFIVAWIGQFVGHVVEGKRPSFFKDVQFLMIGPIWLLSFVYRRFGIPY